MHQIKGLTDDHILGEWHDSLIHGVNLKTVVLDGFSPEDSAMLQALYSRDPKSVLTHVNKVLESGSGKFMERYYVGYNHKSIGDCGSTTVCVEGISMLAAKALQDWRLYNGQESSTRYVDFKDQPIMDPAKTPTSRAIQDRWMEFYFAAQEPVRAHLREKYPKKETEKEDVWERAIVARSFDILRGFLPAGATTNVAWHTNLRQAADHLSLLNHHPLPEVWVMASEIFRSLKSRYPHSFGDKRYPTTEQFKSRAKGQHTYFNPESWTKKPKIESFLRESDLKQYQEHLATRPEKTELLPIISECGDLRAEFLLDFGSFRDLQRHRSLSMPMPLLSTRFGFHAWYLESLPGKIREQAVKLLSEQEHAISTLDASSAQKQYYVAMGYNVPIKITGGLPAFTYVLELRSGTTVHPTLRKVAQEVANDMQKLLPNVALYPDLSLDDWDTRRGNQTITEKPQTV